MIRKVLFYSTISIIISLSNQAFSQQIQRFQLAAEIQKEILISGQEKEISTNVWLDRVNTLELQQFNMIFSIDKNVFVFKIISKTIVGANKIKYIVRVTGEKSNSEVWQINYPERTEFEVYKSEKYYIRYLCNKI